MKEEPRLWEAAIHLRDARNSFVHEGRPYIGRRGSGRRQPVTREKARELVAHAIEVIDFIEGLLPEDHRRPQLELETPTTVETMIRFGRPQDQESDQLP
jgi:hypothetical protein